MIYYQTLNCLKVYDKFPGMKSELIRFLYLSKVEFYENTKIKKYHVESKNFGKTNDLRIFSLQEYFFYSRFSLCQRSFSCFRVNTSTTDATDAADAALNQTLLA